jgi:RHS repeat-associated protein
LSFAYGASGQRILKNVSDPDLDVTGSREHYIRDAQGNIMATYRYTNPGSASLQLNDRPLYGSARLGTLGEEMELHSLLNWDPTDPVVMDQVAVNYELTDQLGNVCAVVTGRLLDGNGGGTLKQAELVSAQGYEPFGSLVPGRKYEAQRARPVIFLPAVLTAGQSVTMTIGGGAPITLVSYTPGWTLAQYLSAICTALGSNGITAVSYPAQNQVRIDNWPSNAVLTTGLPIAEMRWHTYRFAFNGKEKDDDVHGAIGTSYDFGARMYDSRLGRFLCIDPKTNVLPGLSPYSFAANNPITNIELNGCFPGDYKRRLIFCSANNNIAFETQVFFDAAMLYKSYYQSLGGSDEIIITKIKNGPDIIKYLNMQQKGSIKSFDYIGHGGPRGLWFPHDMTKDEKFRRQNLYADGHYRGAENSMENTMSVDEGDIDYGVFTNDARIELHGCGTAGYEEDGVVYGQTFNLGMAMSMGLLQAGKNDAVVIAHYGPAGPDGNADYRQNTRIVYWQGQEIFRTNIKGAISDETIRTRISEARETRKNSKAEF